MVVSMKINRWWRNAFSRAAGSARFPAERSLPLETAARFSSGKERSRRLAQAAWRRLAPPSGGSRTESYSGRTIT
jgi:hypothetical protein